MNRLAKAIHNPWRVYVYAAGKGFTNWVPDEPHLKAMYRGTMGRKLNLANPLTFNEKLQWLKIHDRNPLYTTLVDKYRVKQWVADRIGSEHVTRTYAMWERSEYIDISGLPDRFVLKTNHDCGGVVICRNRAAFDLGAAKEKLAEHLKTNYFWRTREWPYKDVRPCVFAEEYLELDGGSGFDASRGMVDYKFYCFSGEPQFLYVSQGFENHETTRLSFVNMDWTLAPFTRDDYAPLDCMPEKPGCFDDLVEIARTLSAGIPFVRVDLFVYEGRPRFSEMTFCPCAGWMKFVPDCWDAKVGTLLDLKGLGFSRGTESSSETAGASL